MRGVRLHTRENARGDLRKTKLFYGQHLMLLGSARVSSVSKLHAAKIASQAFLGGLWGCLSRMRNFFFHSPYKGTVPVPLYASIPSKNHLSHQPMEILNASL